MTEHCDWFVLRLLLPTPTVWFSLDHKRNVSDGVVSGIGTLFPLDHKLYPSDYDSDSDSVASENQPLWKIDSLGRFKSEIDRLYNNCQSGSHTAIL